MLIGEPWEAEACSSLRLLKSREPPLVDRTHSGGTRASEARTAL